MTRIVAAITLVLGGLLTYRGFAVWTNCGYDCALFARAPSFTATFAVLLGLLLLGASALWLLAKTVAYLLGEHQP